MCNHLKTIPLPSCRSIDCESSGTIQAANAPLSRRRMGVRAAVLGMRVDMMDEEGSRKTPSSAARVVHAPPFHGGSDGFGNRTPPSGASHAANAPLRRRHVGVCAFVVLVLYSPTWIGFRGLEGRRRKKAVSRLIRQRRVLNTRHPSVADLMIEICF
ncbi:hypothetical protein Cgig2_018961 [Carnegiea gigantea]|uniref:Uncharacterized protein n=1 Tax=Carnegiea gigantea TaxID=171969 RepID=A0A9Q1QAK5_9CARY|nr:hypothetical protein Cgig2_018961 [Carnegiea gigantea]